MKHVERTGVRELRQNAGVHLRRVGAGESVEITEPGRLVAVMSLPRSSAIERLRAEGDVVEATSAARWGDVEPGPPIADGPTLGEVLRRMRDEERW